jgi:hypothetical protein
MACPTVSSRLLVFKGWDDIVLEHSIDREFNFDNCVFVLKTMNLKRQLHLMGFDYPYAVLPILNTGCAAE